jgi:CSLREA domain-containing protein
MNSKQKNRTMIKALRLFVTAALLAVSLSALSPARPAHAATITVNSTADVIADDGQCTLREAITAANSDTASGSTEGECDAGSGADTITLPAGTYTLTIAGAGEDSNATGDLDITSDITINGAGADSTVISANGLDRVLQVHGGATVELNGVTLSNGISPNGADDAHCNGGGVRNQGALTIHSSIVTGNASGTNTTSGNGCNGGGVSNESTLTLDNSTISGNATGNGSSGHGGHGGGVFISSGTVTIENSTISGNTTGNGVGSDGHGGGMYVDGGTVTLENSTISGNVARGSGGGVYNNSSSATPTLVHCTVTDNTADADDDDDGAGGGMSWMAGGANVKNTIIADNYNEDPTGTSDDDCDGASSDYNSQGYNVVGLDCPSSGTDLSTSDVGAGNLNNNNEEGSEGITHTHALQHNSPAVERIPVGENGCGTDYTTDQRGEARPQGGLCDVGAHESSYILWDGDGLDNNTSTAANWSGDTTPATTDIPVFNDTSTKNATVDSDLTVGGWIIDSAYTGSGEIDAGSSDLDVNGDWRQEGGTFTAPSPPGEMTLSGNFTHSGGTFAHNNGIVTFDGSGAQILETDVNFYDVTVNSGSTLVKVGASDFTVLSTLTNDGTLQRTQVVNGSSNVSFFNTGGYGGVVLNANDADLGSTTVNIKGNQDCTDVAGETVQRCFDIAPTNTGVSTTVRFYFASSELSDNDCNTLNAYHWDGSNWGSALPLDTSWGDDGRKCESEPYSVQVYPVTDFSPFVLKSGDPPTAVTLARFTARTGLETRFLRETWFLGAPVVLGVAVGALVLQARRR